MAVSVMACSCTRGIANPTFMPKSLVSSRTGPYDLKSPSFEQQLIRLPFLRGNLDRFGRRQSLSSQAHGKLRSTPSLNVRAASNAIFWSSIRLPVTKRSSRRIGRKFQSGTVICCVAGVSADNVVHHEDGEPAGGRVTNLLESFARLRCLPTLFLGLGLALSLKPGHALANEAISLHNKTLLSSAWAGLVAGCLHTLTGPDHLAGLAPLCIGRSRLESAARGALWGFGHDTGQIIFGLIFLLLKDKLHIELIRTWASRVVGAMLITIGAIGIHEAQVPVAVLAEQAGLEKLGSGEETIRLKDDSKNATTFATGVVYGLQPDALLVILPALALPSRVTGAAFLIMFLLGTILAMGSYTLFLASCSRALQKRIPGITKNLTIGSSVIAITLGLGLLVGEIFGFSLF